MKARAVAGVLIFAACSAMTPRGDNPDAHAQFERLKLLGGDWTKSTGDGHEAGTIRYVLTAGGSALEEQFYPGEPRAMVTLYHLDGPDLVLTHYCAAGNQPRMRALPSELDGTIPFVFDGGTNLDPTRDGHMHSLRFRVDGPDAAAARWTFFVGGALHHETDFVLRR